MLPLKAESAAPPQWGPAYRLILALLRGTAEDVTLAGQVAPDDFRRLLTRHGIAAALPPAASLAAVLPVPLTSELAARQLKARLAALLRAATVLQVAEAFKAADVPFCLIKGVAFAALFGDAFSREGQDVDLLVKPADRDRALAALETLGYGLCGVAHDQLDAYFAVEHAVSLVRSQGGPPIEVHIRLGYDDRQFPMALFLPWSHLTTVMIGNAAMPTLAREQAIVYAVFHGAKHNWNRLLWLNDIARALKDPAVDWAAVLACARHMSVGRQLAMAVLLARDVLAAPLPPVLAAETRLFAQAAPLAQALLPHLDDPSRDRRHLAAVMGLRRYLVWLFAQHETWPAKRSLITFLLPVTPEDRAFLSLPSWLAWAYPVVRILRLFGRYRARRMRS